MAAKSESRTMVDSAPQRRIVLLGKTGSGKSSSGNNILDKKVFDSGACGSSVTKKCQRETADRFGHNIQIVDTPGLFDTGMTKADVVKEIVKCFAMTAPGPHAFVLVVRIDRVTEEEQKTVKFFRNIFGEKMVDYLLVLFTRLDDLQVDDKTLAEFVVTAPKMLRDLLKACHHRCIAFNNRGSTSEREEGVKLFLEKVDDILRDNGGSCYTNEMFEEAEKVVQERENQLRKEHEQKRQKEMEEIIREFDRKMNSEKRKHNLQAAQFQDTIKQMKEPKKATSFRRCTQIFGSEDCRNKVFFERT